MEHFHLIKCIDLNFQNVSKMLIFWKEYLNGKKEKY
jgi:hypothetical protein